jgi:hypothetical protein
MTTTQAQIDIRSASFRVLQNTSAHVTFGIWINGGKCGNLTVRQEEYVGFQTMMRRAGFESRSYDHDTNTNTDHAQSVGSLFK